MTTRSLVSAWRRRCLFDLEAGSRQIVMDLYDLRITHRYPQIDKVLAAVEVEDFAPATLLAMLSVTAASATSLSERHAFFVRVKDHLKKTCGPRQAAKMLLGLACEEGWVSA